MCKLLEIHVSLMIIPDRFLSHCAIDPCCVNALMAKKFLDLFDGHTGCKQICCTCSSEPVRMDILNAGGSADAVYDIFQAAPGKSIMGSFTADKESRIVVCAGTQIIFKVYVGAGIEICHALLVAFSEHDYIIFCK